MNYFRFILKSALFDFSRNKGRTFLTSLGILIGVLSVVLLTAFTLGLKEYIRQQFESLGTNLIYIMPGDLSSGGGMAAAGGIGGIKFTLTDAQKVSRVPGVEAALPMTAQFSKTQGETDTKTYEVVGGPADVFNTLNLEIDKGEMFTKADVGRGAKVAVIGSKVATEIFADADSALGKKIRIDNLAFRVVGILIPKGGGGLGGPSMDEHVFIPYTAASPYLEDKKFYAIYAKAANGTNLATVKADIKKELLKKYDEDKFSVADQTEILSIINSIFAILNTVLVAIAAISLLVGGIGIMNIMYVSVTERIKEIGIRRAVGATKSDILAQFLLESVILSLFGGLVGLLLAFLITLAVKSIFPAYIDLGSVALALGVSSIIGIVFGVLPARKAANLSPIEAIRYE
ncbi:ABC transporter permease [Patescibacteria group bacterium]|nr:ABC transporter permease [Patescibacteria group bacterium]